MQDGPDGGGRLVSPRMTRNATSLQNLQVCLFGFYAFGKECVVLLVLIATSVCNQVVSTSRHPEGLYRRHLARRRAVVGWGKVFLSGGGCNSSLLRGLWMIKVACGRVGERCQEAPVAHRSLLLQNTNIPTQSES